MPTRAGGANDGYLLLLEPFDGELGLPLGEELAPEEAPPEVCPEELPLAADDGLLEALLLPDPAF